MVFSQQVNIVYEFHKTCFWSCLLEIAFRKKNLANRYSPLIQSLQNALFLVSVALKQMSCCCRSFVGSPAASARGAGRQSSSSAPGVQSLSPPCRGSWTSESQGQSSFPPIILNHSRDNPHYESLLLLVPETSDIVFMIHNIIRGAHSRDIIYNII